MPGARDMRVEGCAVLSFRSFQEGQIGSAYPILSVQKAGLDMLTHSNRHYCTSLAMTSIENFSGTNGCPRKASLSYPSNETGAAREVLCRRPFPPMEMASLAAEGCQD